jgi:hypothetical protein
VCRGRGVPPASGPAGDKIGARVGELFGKKFKALGLKRFSKMTKMDVYFFLGVLTNPRSRRFKLLSACLTLWGILSCEHLL